MRTKELLALYDQQERRGAGAAPGTERIVTPHTIRHVEMAGGRSFVLHSDLRELDDAALDAVISDETAFFTAQGKAFEWKVYEHDAPPDLRDRLVARGFSAEDWETLLIRELAGAPDRLFDLRGHVIERLSDPAQVDELMAVENAVWGPDEHGHGERLQREMTGVPNAISLFLARVQGIPVGAAWMTYTPDSDFASLWGGSVVEQYRGQGIYGALLAARAREAAVRGRRFLMIDAGPMSHPIVESLGFVRVSSSCPCVYSPSGT